MSNLTYILVSLIVLISFPCLPCLGYGTDIDRLQELEKKGHKDTADLAEMLVITAGLLKESPSATLPYLEKVRIAAEANDYYRGLVAYSDQILAIYSENNQYKEALETVRKVYEKHERRFNREEQGTLKLLMAIALDGEDKVDEALEILSEILPHAETPVRQAQVHLQRALVYHKKGKYKEAVSDYLEAIRRYKPLNDLRHITLVYNGLGGLFADMEDFQRSIGYYKRAIDFARRAGVAHTEAMVYSNIGTVYRRLDSNDVALHYLHKGLELAKELDNPMNVAQNLMNIANVQVDLKQFDDALKNYKSSLEMCYAFDIKYGIMLNYINIGDLHVQTQHYASSKLAFDSALVYTQLLKLPNEEAQLHEHYASLYTEMGDYKTALDHFRTYYEKKNQLINDENNKAISELQIKYETAVKDDEIAKRKAANRVLVLAIVFVVTITGLIIFFLIYRNRTLRELYERNVELLNAFQSSKKQQPPQDIAEAGEWDVHKKVFEGLLYLLETNKIYTDPHLTLGELAEKLKTNGTYLSSAISTHAKMNYNNFINFYRINEAKRLIHDMGYNTSLNEVMYACGFNSRTTFYNAFNKFTGMSPKQFKYLSQSSKPTEQTLPVE